MRRPRVCNLFRAPPPRFLIFLYIVPLLLRPPNNRSFRPPFFQCPRSLHRIYRVRYAIPHPPARAPLTTEKKNYKPPPPPTTTPHTHTAATFASAYLLASSSRGRRARDDDDGGRSADVRGTTTTTRSSHSHYWADGTTGGGGTGTISKYGRVQTLSFGIYTGGAPAFVPDDVTDEYTDVHNDECAGRELLFFPPSLPPLLFFSPSSSTNSLYHRSALLREAGGGGGIAVLPRIGKSVGRYRRPIVDHVRCRESRVRDIE